jgi:hypothetical protein
VISASSTNSASPLDNHILLAYNPPTRTLITCDKRSHFADTFRARTGIHNARIYDGLRYNDAWKDWIKEYGVSATPTDIIEKLNELAAPWGRNFTL